MPNHNLLNSRESNSDCESSKNSEVTHNGRESVIDLTNESRINLSDVSLSDFDDNNDDEIVSKIIFVLYVLISILCFWESNHFAVPSTVDLTE